MRILFTGLFSFLHLLLCAQHCDWMALTDCGYLINMRQLCTDDRGNVYTAGEYEGEVLFHSASSIDTAITKYTSESWHKTFVTRYDSVGRLQLVVQFKSSGGNSDVTYVEGLAALPNGDFVVFVMSNGRVEYVDPKGIRSQPNKNSYGKNLYCIDANGQLKWSVKAPITHCKFLQVDVHGMVYLIGEAQQTFSNENVLIKYSNDGTQINTLFTGGPSPMAFCMKESKLYLLVSNGGNGNRKIPKTEHTQFEMPENNMGLYELDTTLKPKQLFVCGLPMRKGYSEQSTALNFKAAINLTSKELFVDILFQNDYGIITFLDKQYSKSSKNTQLIRLNQKGTAMVSIAFDSRGYNCNIVPAPNGSLYLYTAVGGNAFTLGSDSILLPQHTEFIDELILMKLDEKFNRVWWVTGGSTASNYHTSCLTTDNKDELFVVSDLLAPSIAYGYELKIPWRCVTYVVKLQE